MQPQFFSKIKVVLLSRDISSYKQDSGATTGAQLNEFQTDASGTRYTTFIQLKSPFSLFY